jgi:hypothetical protein
MSASVFDVLDSLKDMVSGNATPPDAKALGELPHALVDRIAMGGPQKVYRFANDYGASVVCHVGSYGYPRKWELAVLKYDGAGEWDWNICYDTPLTEGVIGHLTAGEVRDLLVRIEALPKDGDQA